MLSPYLKLYYPYWNKRLTVLAYHRIVSDEIFAAHDAKIAVSTSVSNFKQQMQFIQQHFSLISMETLQLFLQGNCELPPRPALITFDDGYQDVLTQAMPILEQFKIPATVFLATEYMGTERMFLWDRATYCFEQTLLQAAKLPLLGECTWETLAQREQLLKQWLAESKRCSDSERQAATHALEQVLQVQCPAKNKGGTAFLTWNQIRSLVEKGVSFGSHTCNHPILTKITRQQLSDELVLSKKKIEQEIKQDVLSFAYPNGLAGDFNRQIIDLLKELGYQCAFTLLAGPSPLKHVQKQPLQIQRVTITAKDNYQRFILKLMGIVRLKQKLKG